MSLIVTALLSAGPSLLRLFGDSKGGHVQQVTDTLATVLDATQGRPAEERQAEIESQLNQLDPNIVQEVKSGLAQIEAERENNRLNHDLGMHTEQQKTIRSSQDIQGTRPAIANRHSYFTALYLFVFEGLEAFSYGTGANWEIATLLASPTLAWFGFRTWDKFSRQGATR